MARALVRPRALAHDAARGLVGRSLQLSQEQFTMQWQTPQATDLRLGFEITMYVAAR